MYKYDSYLNEISIKIINLKRREDRKSQFIINAKNNHINNYEFFEAVDGRNLVLNDEIIKLFKTDKSKKKCVFNFHHNYRKPVLGCALSHYYLWKNLLNDKKDAYLILEDDVFFTPKFNENLNRVYATVKNDNQWDILFLGFNDTFFYIYNDTYVYDDILKFSKMSRFHGSGFYGYIIRKSGVKKLLELIDKHNIQEPIDNFAIACFDSICAYVVNPQILKAEIYSNGNNIDTDIQNNFQILENSDKI